MGTTNNKQTRAAIELDLTAARILDLVPGLTKPAGKPLKAKFNSNDAGKSIRIDDLTLDGSAPTFAVAGTLRRRRCGRRQFPPSSVERRR